MTIATQSAPTILVTEAYTAANIGDLELVTRSASYANKAYPDATKVCLAVDPNSFNEQLPIPAHGRLFPRLDLHRGGTLSRVSTYLKWAVQAATMSITAILPASARRSAVKQLVRLRLLPKTAALYASAEAVIAVGGGYLGDQYVKETLMTLWTWWWAGRLGATVETMPLSYEVESPLLRWATRRLAGRVKWRARDTPSQQALIAAGVNVKLLPDLAFANQREPSEERAGVLVSLVGSDYLQNTECQALIHGVAVSLSRRAEMQPIKLLTMHSKMSNTAVGGDLDMSLKLAEALAGLGVTEYSIANASTYAEVCELTARAAIVLSARMHAGIAGLCTGARVGLLAYEGKHSALMNDLRLNEFTIPITSSDEKIDELVERLSKANSDDFVRAAAGYKRTLVASGLC